MPLIVSGCSDAGGLQDRRYNVDDMMELPANSAHIRDVTGPGHRHALGRSAVMRRDLLAPFKRSVHGPGPAGGKVREGAVRSPERVPEKLILYRHFNAVEGGKLVRRSVDHAFGTRAIVAADIDDQGVIQLTHVFDGLDDSADLVVGIGEVSAIHVGLFDEEFLLLARSSESHSGSPFGHGVSWAFSGMMPNLFWLAKMVSRTLFQPPSNRCMSLIFLIHSGVG